MSIFKNYYLKITTIISLNYFFINFDWEMPSDDFILMI